MSIAAPTRKPAAPAPDASAEVLYTHHPAVLDRHQRLVNEFLEAVYELIKHDKTEGLLKAEITAETIKDIHHRDGRVTPAFKADMPLMPALGKGIDMGFQALYFIPYPAAQKGNYDKMPAIAPPEWIKLEPTVGPYGFAERTFIFQMPLQAPPVDGRKGVLFGRPNSANEVLRDYLINLRDHPERFPITAAVQLFTMREDRVREGGSLHRPDLTAEQNACLNFFVQNPATVIWGPPGTGKSTILCALIEQSLENGERVLCTSNTNKAIDSVAEKLFSIASNTTKPRPIVQKAVAGNQVTRYGSPTSPKVIKNIAYSVRAANAKYVGEPIMDTDQSLANDQVSICTNFRFLNTHMPGYDVVMIDEVGAITVPVIYCVACSGAKKVVVSGDPAQLPPVYPYSGSARISRATSHLFKTDLYRYVGIRTDPHEAADKRLSAFSLQHRMSDNMAALVRLSGLYRSYVTAEGLRESPSSHIARMSHPLPGKDFVVVDTSHIGTPRFVDKTNPTHARVVQQMIMHYLGKKSMGMIGVISPYRNQATVISRWLREQNLAKVTSGTVHQFQGSEFPLGIWDTVESASASDKPPTHFYTDDLKYPENTANLINVACSRAQGKFVMIANIDYIKENLTPGCYVHRLLEHAANTASVIPAMMALSDMGRSLDATIEGGANFAKDPFDVRDATPQTFYALLAEDATQARSSLHIYSKEVSKSHLYQMITWLDGLCRKQHIVAELFVPGNLPGDVKSMIKDNVRSRPHLGVRRCSEWPHGYKSFLAFDGTLVYEAPDQSGGPPERPDLLNGELPNIFFRYRRAAAN